jgi:hypothetical protein
MKQFFSGKVMSLLDTTAVTCVSGQMTAIGGLESPLPSYISVRPPITCTGDSQKKLEWLRRKRRFQAFLTPHLGLSDLIPKSLPIREVNKIFTLSGAYQRGSRDDHFLAAFYFLSEVIFASLGATGTKRGTTQLPSCMYEANFATVVCVATQEPAT